MLKEPSHTSLLLPLPYVSGYDLVSRQSNVSNKINTTPQRFSVSPNPYQGKLEGEIKSASIANIKILTSR